MKDNDEIRTCGKIIKEAREEKNMTINDLAFEIKSKNVTEKTVKNWEDNKDYPNLDMIYKLAYILEINPTELLVFRDKCRKKFIKKNNKIKTRKFNKEEFVENFYYIFIASCRVIIIVGVVIFLVAFLRLYDSSINGGAKEIDDYLVNTVENQTSYYNEIENKENIF